MKIRLQRKYTIAELWIKQAMHQSLYLMQRQIANENDRQIFKMPAKKTLSFAFLRVGIHLNSSVKLSFEF